MKQILLLGAGRSATVLIDYLLQYAEPENWQITIGDVSTDHLRERLQGQQRASAIALDILKAEQLQELIRSADLVISLLPALFHPRVAKECLAQRKHLITASYVSAEVKKMHEEAKEKGLIFIMESGLDPGIDHMSAMQVIDRLRKKGARLTSFKSYTGGLVAPASDDNPWHYKISWNPRNVVLAGQGAAKYLKYGAYKYIPYNRLFSRTDKFEVLNYGMFDGYANRDSLSYREPYGLHNIPTILRGTLRREGFCSSWNILIQLGLTDDTYQIENSDTLTYAQWMESYLPHRYGAPATLKERVAEYVNQPTDSEEMQNIAWLGLFDDKKIDLPNATPAQILEKLLTEKWKLEPQDRDMVVMQHLFEYELNGKEHLLTSSLVVEGENSVKTAMAKTVGLPVAISAKLLLQGKINQRGVIIPIKEELYNPVLEELEEHGIKFIEEEKEKEQIN